MTIDGEDWLGGVDHQAFEGITQYFGSMVEIDLIGQQSWNAILRLNLCDWTLTQDDEVIAASNEFGKVNNLVIEPLTGQQLVSFEKKGEHVFSIELSNGACFSLTANLDEYEPEDTLFTLYVNSDYGVEYSPELGFRTGLK